MPRNRPYHPDYIAAPDARKFRGGTLRDLFALLNSEITVGAGSHRILPSGACVSMAVDNTGLRRVRISRREHAKVCPGTDAACICTKPGSLFHRETETFQKNFGIDGWQVKPDPNARGIALIMYEQLPKQ